jgi:hypothetical protein
VRVAQGPTAAEAATDRSVTFWLGGFLFAYYLLTLGGHQYSLDGIVAFQSAKSLVFRHSLLLDPPVRWGEDMPYSFVGVGLSLAYVPALLLLFPVLVWRPALKAIPYDPALLRNPALYANLPYLLCSWLNPALTAATGCLVFRLGRMLGLERRWALGAALAFGVASPAAAYARYDFNQPLAAFMLTATVYGLLRAVRDGLGPVAVAGAALGYAILTRYEAAALAPLAAMWVYRTGPDRRALASLRRLTVLTVPIVAAIAINLWINHMARPGRILGGSVPIGTMFPLSPSGIVVGALGLLISPARGLLLFFPLAALALPGFLRVARDARGLAVLLGGFVVAPFAIYAGYYGWWSGWSWGPRYLVPSLSLLALGAAAWAADGRKPGRRAIFVGFAAIGVIVSWNGMLFDPLEFTRWMFTADGITNSAAAQFRFDASSLVRGWLEPSDHSLDILWLRAVDGEQIHRYGRFVADGMDGRWPDLIALARVSSVAVAAVLLGMLVLAGRKLARLAR